MSTLKKSQHYVWRKYLRSWSKGEKIWTFFIKQNKVENTNLMNVGQENYFYKVQDITDIEEEFLMKYISDSRPVVQDLLLRILTAYTTPMKARRVTTISQSSEFVDFLKKVEINLMENVYGIIENKGEKLMVCENIESLISLLKDVHERNEAVMYVSSQYFRTKRIKERLIANMKSTPEFSPKNIWNIFGFLVSINVAMNISIDPKLRFLFIENPTEEMFITSDQPVINILGDERDENGDILGLELYYPLTPRRSLIIDLKNENNQMFQNLTVQKDMVQWFNKKICENANAFIFSDGKEQLDKLTRV